MDRPLEGVFVTGTDTGVGKTRVACALVAKAAAGLRVAGLKPISAGLEPTPEGPRHPDALALMRASPVALRYEQVNPFALGEAVAPHLAAAAEGRTLERAAVAAAVRAAAAGLDAVVVEGVGGFVVPLGPDWDTADLAQDLGLPVVLVVGLRLGCLNHALLTREAIARRGLRFAGWAASAIDPGFARAAGNLAALEARLGAPPLGVLPHAPYAHAGDAARHLERLPDALRKP
jgi:dethiobiotin synthetase